MRNLKICILYEGNVIVGERENGGILESWKNQFIPRQKYVPLSCIL